MVEKKVQVGLVLLHSVPYTLTLAGSVGLRHPQVDNTHKNPWGTPAQHSHVTCHAELIARSVRRAITQDGVLQASQMLFNVPVEPERALNPPQLSKRMTLIQDRSNRQDPRWSRTVRGVTAITCNQYNPHAAKQRTGGDSHTALVSYLNFTSVLHFLQRRLVLVHVTGQRDLKVFIVGREGHGRRMYLLHSHAPSKPKE